MPGEEVFVSSDNALGSTAGDVDDAFAVAALMKSRTLATLASIYGNTSMFEASENHRRLAKVCGWPGGVVQGASAPGEIRSGAARVMSSGTRVLALGPLTDVASAILPPREVIVVGANLGSRGKWPPLWPAEFNLTADVAATIKVFGEARALTVIPLDVARRLAIRSSQLEAIGGELGAFLRAGAKRWFRRNLLLKWPRWFPAYDLAGAMYVIDPSLFRAEERSARAWSNGWIEFAAPGASGFRPVNVVTGFDPERVWARFLDVVNAA